MESRSNTHCSEDHLGGRPCAKHGQGPLPSPGGGLEEPGSSGSRGHDRQGSGSLLVDALTDDAYFALRVSGSGSDSEGAEAEDATQTRTEPVFMPSSVQLTRATKRDVG